MTRIATNIGSTRGLRNLNKANNSLDSALQRLSTGSQINNGKDNPSGLVAGEKLRLQVTTIEQSIKNSNRASNVIATADGALGEISGLLNQIRGLVQEGLNQGALSSSEIEANQLQLDAALSAINRISSNTTFAGDKLLDGSKSFTTSSSTADAAKLSDFRVNEALLGSSTSVSIDAVVTSAAEKAELQYSGGALTGSTSLQVSGAQGSQVLNFDSGSTVENVRDAINSVSDATGVSASVSVANGLTIAEGAQAGTFELSTNAIKNTGSLTQTTSGSITVTDARGSATEGSDTTLGGSVSIEFVNSTANSAASILGITTNATGDVNIQIELQDGTDGDGITDFSELQALIAGNATAAGLVSVSDNASVGGIAVQAPVTLSGGVDGESVTFSDNRATTAAGAFGTLGGSLSIELLSAGSTQATAATAANGDVTVSVDIASGATLQQVVDAIATDQTAGGAAEFITTDVTNIGTGTTLAIAAASQSFTDGHDGLNNDVTFTDVRADSSVGDVRVAFADPGANDSPLSITIGGTANDPDITVNLATDANGNIISTAADVAAAIAADGAASLIVSAEASGDGSELVSASGALAAVDSAAGTLVLTSDSFGSQNFVEVDVLSGSFATTLDDTTTVAGRDTGADIGVTINGQAAQTSGLTASIRTSSLDASISFTSASNTAANTASITVSGGGATFQIGEDVSTSGQLGIGIESVNTARLGGITGKLFELGSGGGKSLLDIGPGQSGADLVSIVDEALDRVSTLRGRLGSIQKNVIETNIATLGVALENISEARSQIVDADFAKETANLTKSQILSQAGISVLSIANQQPQQVLSLLG